MSKFVTGAVGAGVLAAAIGNSAEANGLDLSQEVLKSLSGGNQNGSVQEQGNLAIDLSNRIVDRVEREFERRVDLLKGTDKHDELKEYLTRFREDEAIGHVTPEREHELVQKLTELMELTPDRDLGKLMSKSAQEDLIHDCRMLAKAVLESEEVPQDVKDVVDRVRIDELGPLAEKLNSPVDLGDRISGLSHSDQLKLLLTAIKMSGQAEPYMGHLVVRRGDPAISVDQNGQATVVVEKKAAPVVERPVQVVETKTISAEIDFSSRQQSVELSESQLKALKKIISDNPGSGLEVTVVSKMPDGPKTRQRTAEIKAALEREIAGSRSELVSFNTTDKGASDNAHQLEVIVVVTTTSEAFETRSTTERGAVVNGTVPADTSEVGEMVLRDANKKFGDIFFRYPGEFDNNWEAHLGSDGFGLNWTFHDFGEARLGLRMGGSIKATADFGLENYDLGQLGGKRNGALDGITVLPRVGALVDFDKDETSIDLTGSAGFGIMAGKFPLEAEIGIGVTVFNTNKTYQLLNIAKNTSFRFGVNVPMGKIIEGVKGLGKKK